VQYIDHLFSEELAVYMAFFDWLDDGKRKLQSYQAYWKALSRYFSILARHEFSNNVTKQIGRVILFYS
jgi:hypothetical protein